MNNRMSLVFIEGGKKIEFNVINYQYPERVATEDYDYDANWLMVEIAYSNRAEKNTYYDPCLLTYEFIDLIDGIDEILAGRETGYITDFMEPYLKFSVTKVGDLFAVQIRFVYDTTDGQWKEIYVSQGVSYQELNAFSQAGRQLCEQFPERKRCQ